MTKKILCLALAAVLCISLFGCSKKNNNPVAANDKYEWTNEYGITFDVDTLDYTQVDISTLYNSDGYLPGITATDYVTLPDDYTAIPVPADAVAVDPAVVQDYIDTLMQSFGACEHITDRAVEDGDLVNIDYVGSIGGVEFSGGNTGGYGTVVTAGSTEYVDDFLTQIIGHKPGETINVEVTFPETYGNSTDLEGNEMVMANQEAVFVTTINYIQGDALECTDEWVRENLQGEGYNFTTVQELRDSCETYESRQMLFTYVGEYITNNSELKFPLPQSLLDYSARSLLYSQLYYAYNVADGDLEAMMKMQGYSCLEEYLDKNIETLMTDVRSALVEQALAEAYDLHTTEQEAQELLGDDYAALAGERGVGYAKMYVNALLAHNKLCSSAVADDKA